MRVEVYRNLRNGLMSVREVSGLVLDHAEQVFMSDVRFVVQPAGRERVLREQRKNVHAFVRGELRGFSIGSNQGFDDWEGWTKVTYNPYEAPYFYPAEWGPACEIRAGSQCVVTTKGVFYKL